MKKFKDFLENYDPYLDMTKKRQDKENFNKIAADYLNANSQLNQYNSNWQTDMYMAKMLYPKNTPERMEAEKNMNTDIGLAFDLSPDGELIASPEGFKAVAQRTKEKRNIPTVQPAIDLDKYKKELLYNITFGLMGSKE